MSGTNTPRFRPLDLNLICARHRRTIVFTKIIWDIAGAAYRWLAPDADPRTTVRFWAGQAVKVFVLSRDKDAVLNSVGELAGVALCLLRSGKPGILRVGCTLYCTSVP